MEIIKTNIEGVVIIEPRIFKDDVVISLNLFLKENLRKRFVKRLFVKIMKVSLAMEY